MHTDFQRILILYYITKALTHFNTYKRTMWLCGYKRGFNRFHRLKARISR